MTLNMQCPRSVTVKEEHDIDFYDNGVDFLKMDFNVRVKIENGTLLGEDWCLENNDLLREIDKRFAEIDEYVCNICDQNFTDSHLLFQHNLEHLEVVLDRETIYVCDLCSAGYLTKEKLLYHMTYKHKELFKHTKNLDTPITKSHHKCKICKKVYKYKTWHYHMRTVHAQRSEKCKQCGVIFKCYRYLQRHIKYVHDGVKPRWRICPVVEGKVCACDECGKKFKNKISLETHKRNCHSVRTYQCYICESVLKCKSYLVAHIQRVHYFDGLEHACPICRKTFRSPRYLKVHIKNSHGKPKKHLSDTSIES